MPSSSSFGFRSVFSSSLLSEQRSVLESEMIIFKYVRSFQLFPSLHYLFLASRFANRTMQSAARFVFLFGRGCTATRSWSPISTLSWFLAKQIMIFAIIVLVFSRRVRLVEIGLRNLFSRDSGIRLWFNGSAQRPCVTFRPDFTVCTRWFST